jgi:hypothetical protein
MDDSEIRLLEWILKDCPEIGSDTPCARNPKMWDGDELEATEAAIDACDNDCPALARCREWMLAEERPLSGVVAGLRFPPYPPGQRPSRRRRRQAS